MRQTIRDACRDALDKKIIPLKADSAALRMSAGMLINKYGLDEQYLAYIMVQIGNRIAENAFAEVPYEKRLLLLPHCLRDIQNCRGVYDDVQLLCAGCGRCVLDAIIKKAETLGYIVLIAEGTPIVIRMLLEKEIEGVLGVSCLESLEKAFVRVQEAGIPCLAVPLLSDGCRETSMDKPAFDHYLELHAPSVNPPAGKNRIDKLAESVFAKAMELYPAPRNRTETIARDYLLIGGKRIRPLLTVAIYSTLLKEEDIPESVYKAALAIELFHKASLIHDDIEDASSSRHGRPTLHHQYNLAVATNIGDFMLGLGYRLLTELGEKTDPAKHLQLMNIFSQTHTNMSSGQGLELLWYLDKNTPLTPEEILDIYNKKTSEAYRAAIMAGAALADADPQTLEALEAYAHTFGIAFQIHDDLNDIVRTKDGAFVSSAEIEGGEPTFLYALAMKNLSPENQNTLSRLMSKSTRSKIDVNDIFHLMRKANAFKDAHARMQGYLNRSDDALKLIANKNLVSILEKIRQRIFGK